MPATPEMWNNGRFRYHTSSLSERCCSIIALKADMARL